MALDIGTSGIRVSDEQLRTLRKLARASSAAKEAAALRQQLSGFTSDNEILLKHGVTVDGLRLGVRITRQLLVEAA